MVLEMFPDNFALILQCDGPLLDSQQRERFEVDPDYADSFSPAVIRWMVDFGSNILPEWDRAPDLDFNIIMVGSHTDESSLPLPVPAAAVDAASNSIQVVELPPSPGGGASGTRLRADGGRLSR